MHALSQSIDYIWEANWAPAAFLNCLETWRLGDLESPATVCPRKFDIVFTYKIIGISTTQSQHIRYELSPQKLS